jgi:hypothetical protein
MPQNKEGKHPLSYAWLLFALLLLAAVSCTVQGLRSKAVPGSVKTPTGNEALLSCPRSFEQMVNPTEVAKLLGGGWNIRTPLPTEGVYLPGALTPQPDSLEGLLPPNPYLDSGRCLLQTNAYISGAWTGWNKEELDQLGRLCGCALQSEDPTASIQIQLHLYVTSRGAEEAYRRQKGWYDDDDVIEAVSAQSIGDERALRYTPGTTKAPGTALTTQDAYSFLFRRRNVVVSLFLQYHSESFDAKGPPDPMLEYAAQIDQNIQAAAAAQATATSTPAP